MTYRMIVASCSPSGSTHRVARRIESELIRLGAEVFSYDLGASRGKTEALARIRADGIVGLFLGSPVYKDLTAPTVMAFIEALPEARGIFVVPFVTWGGVSCGIALWQMGRTLAAKGYTLAGAVSVPAVHSLMWSCEHALGRGHPSPEDEAAVAELVNKVFAGFKENRLQGVSPDALDEQPPERGEEMKRKIAQEPVRIPKELNRDACTQCGLCAEACPAEAVVLSPWPEFTSACMDCMTCHRLCPEHAIEISTLSAVHDRIRKRAANFQETLVPRIFFAP